VATTRTAGTEAVVAEEGDTETSLELAICEGDEEAVATKATPTTRMVVAEGEVVEEEEVVGLMEGINMAIPMEGAVEEEEAMPRTRGSGKRGQGLGICLFSLFLSAVYWREHIF